MGKTQILILKNQNKIKKTQTNQNHFLASKNILILHRLRILSTLQVGSLNIT
jgi:hypothetical protein